MEEDYEVWLLMMIDQSWSWVYQSHNGIHFRFQEAQITQLQQQLQAARKEFAARQKASEVQCSFATQAIVL